MIVIVDRFIIINLDVLEMFLRINIDKLIGLVIIVLIAVLYYRR